MPAAGLSEKAGVQTVMISGSHSHHGPVIELTDREGFGKGRFDDAVAYSKRLPEFLIEAIVEATDKLQPAKIGVAKRDFELNRNRHTKQTIKTASRWLFWPTSRPIRLQHRSRSSNSRRTIPARSKIESSRCSRPIAYSCKAPRGT